MIRLFALSCVSLCALTAATVAQEAQQFDARLSAHAQLPAQTFLVPPSDAPVSLNVSGRFAGGESNEALYGTYNAGSGLATPFPGQPLQVFRVSARSAMIASSSSPTMALATGRIRPTPC